MYARYEKQRVNGKDRFQIVGQVSLFGCNEGFIPWLLSKQIRIQVQRFGLPESLS